jgi:hypothetical protein
MTSDTNSLEQVVEEVRTKLFPQLSEKLVQDILLIEKESIEARPQALKRIAELIDAHINSQDGA